MTKRKPRSSEPYTMNLVMSCFVGFDEPLKKVLGQYFQQQVCDEMSKRIFDELMRYQTAVKSNPDRKITKEQQKDRHELIETMKELSVRLFPLHIPRPMYEPAKNAYRPCKGGKGTLPEEIGDLLLRLGHLQCLFESIDIHTPTKTNPGKPERDHLANGLADIFDEFANIRGSLKKLGTDKVPGGMRDVKSHFIADVFRVFNVTDPVPRTLI